MNNRLPTLAAALAVLAAPISLPAQDPPPSEAIYEEDFENPGTNLGSKGWFSYSVGSSVTASATEEASMGVDGSRALVFRFAGADSNGVQSYWIASLGRNAIQLPEGATPDRLQFSAFMQLPSESKARSVGVRFIQGSAEKPTWTSSHRVEVEPMGNVVSFRLADGKITGEFTPGRPVTLHTISFGNDRFGFNREIEFGLDNVRLGWTPALP